MFHAFTGGAQFEAYIEVSDPCKGLITYGHTGLAFGNQFMDIGTSAASILGWVAMIGPYWSHNFPNLSGKNSLESAIGVIATAPTFKITYCMCRPRAKRMQMKMDLFQNFPGMWGISGITCSSAVAGVLRSCYRPFITPDDILTDIAPKLVNTCGTQRGKAPHMELMKNTEKFKS